MKQVVIDRYGAPEDVAACAEVPDVGAPAAGEVVFDVLLFPINPADVSFCKGLYRLKPALPATPGAECIGRVTAVGAGVSHVKPGDLVINLQRENWTQKRRVDAAGRDRGAGRARPPPGRHAAHQPAHGALAPDRHRRIEAGRLGDPERRQLGRRAPAHPPGKGARAAHAERGAAPFALRRARGARRRRLRRRRARPRRGGKAGTGGAPIRLGIDAVSGRATTRISSCLGEGGVVCNYGSMSGEDPVMPRGALTSGGQKLVGFVLGRGLATRSLTQIRALYADLAQQLLDGRLSAPVEKIYPIEEIKTALAHAQQGERTGKILVAPNGMI
jgi:NADPH:quinone reductase-like Zn-dependent oxidoreductase